ncbi:MAG: family 20 glycosylhydrolase [Candidatus Pseudobacter hemicellulosilyticus]|uniref:beta-N-acetylhexosaminidase n=1 Tax=Candidatus Pseudobacter hemicellulosilyticus TaxID=3121375 RepID=A0AAJ5WR29_9BACT|nr:MAG: family 20 glycosylhydrolase [Pseudobacter sp.]
MKKSILIACFSCWCMTVLAQADIALIPQPVSLQKNEGHFILGSSTRIQVSAQPDAYRVGEILAGRLRTTTGYPLPVKQVAPSMGNPAGAIELQLQSGLRLGKEGYALEVTPTHVIIRAKEPAGLFYGMQTLLQLLPKQIQHNKKDTSVAWTIPAVTIEDQPRFAWRGLHFDVARHFFTKEQVKRYIDEMVAYKYNLLHLHLTDDQGWRIEIKSLPRLTEVGAWRVEKTGSFGTFSPPTPDEPRTYGGYFTQEDLKELVRYAADRFVQIMPEIDVPGHSMAAVAAYPELSCTPGAKQVNSGEKFMNWGTGSFSAIVDNTLCPANEEVYTFLDKVITEVAAIFPFEYIHMGGDECAKNFWEKSTAVKQLMQREKLKDMHEVQSYFMKRVEKLVAARGKKMMGWDEILEGGLPPKTAVMSWRGVKGGIEAARMGHPVVMTPNTNTYLDLMQGDPSIEPPVYSSVRLRASYDFEPVPDGVDDKLVLGGQANLWTENIYTTRHQQYMLWPRAFAVAEAVWSPKGRKDWPGFISRVEQHFQRFDEAAIKYARSMYDPIVQVKKEGDSSVSVTLSTEVPGLDIYYSFDNSFPDRFYPQYTQALVPPKDALSLKLITYRGKEEIGRQMTIPVVELKRRSGIRK